MKLADVIRPAIEYAQEGITVTPTLSNVIKDNFDKVSKFPTTAAIYLKDGLPYEPGDKLINKDYARVLRLIADKGPDVFYKGEIADAIARDMAAYGGLITIADLSAYKPAIREPVRGTYRGYEVISASLPSSGGTHVIRILGMLENYDNDFPLPEEPEDIGYVRIIGKADEVLVSGAGFLFGGDVLVDVGYGIALGLDVRCYPGCSRGVDKVKGFIG